MREMKDGGVQWIGEIPEKWAIVSTKFLFTIISGATPESAKSENWDGNIRWITPADYKTKDVYVAVGRRNLTQMGFDSCSTNGKYHLFKAGTHWFCRNKQCRFMHKSRMPLLYQQRNLFCKVLLLCYVHSNRTV